MMQSVRTSAAIATLLVGSTALPGCREEAPKPPPPSAAPALTPADQLTASQQHLVAELSGRVLDILDKLPRVESNAVAGAELVSPLGRLETPNISEGVAVWSEISHKAQQGAITLDDMHDRLPISYEALNQLYLYSKFYRQGHANLLRQEELFVLDGHPRNPAQNSACAAQVEKADTVMLQIAEAVRGIRVLAQDLKISLDDKSPFEEKFDNISLKRGAQKALRELLGFAQDAVADLSDSDRVLYIHDEAVRERVLAKLPTNAPEIVTLDIHDFTEALSQTSVLLLTAQSNQTAKLQELMSEGLLEAEVSSPAAKAYLKAELERANFGLNRRAQLDWQLEYLGKFVEQMAVKARILPDPKANSKPPRF